MLCQNFLPNIDVKYIFLLLRFLAAIHSIDIFSKPPGSEKSLFDVLSDSSSSSALLGRNFFARQWLVWSQQKQYQKALGVMKNVPNEQMKQLEEWLKHMSQLGINKAIMFLCNNRLRLGILLLSHTLSWSSIDPWRLSIGQSHIFKRSYQPFSVACSITL